MSGVFTIVTAAPIPTMLYNWTMSLERIRCSHNLRVNRFSIPPAWP